MENHNSTEEEQPPPQSSPFSWWSDSHNRPPHSQWLHSTLAELDEKIKMILDLIEDDGETFAKRAEMYYEKKPQLIKMVQELHRSYRALADKYDHQLKSESSIKASNTGSLSSSSRNLQSQLKHKPHINLSPIEAPNFNSDESDEGFSAAGESGTSSFGHDQSPKNYTPSVYSNNAMQKGGSDDDEDYSDKSENIDGGENIISEKIWSEPIKFEKLLEENLSTQAELIRRNDEKREVINELMNEKRVLSYKNSGNSSSHDSKVTKKGNNQSQKRNFRGLFCLA